MALVYGAAMQEPIDMSAWTIIRIMAGGPVGLLLGMIVAIIDQPQRHRKESKHEQHNINAYLSNKIVEST